MSNDINGFEIDNFNVHGIPAKAKQSTCPECSHTRKKQKDKCMSVFWDTGLGSCNHCGALVQLHTYKKALEIKDYEKPDPKSITINRGEKVISYMKSRSISENTLENFKIRESIEWMPQTSKNENCLCFDYYLNGEVINTKYRDARKNFKLYKGAEKILYNIDSIKTSTIAIIVEGEIDALSFHEIGEKNVVSVPNGFNLQGSVNLSYLDNYIHYFDNKEQIFIAVDNDEAGRKGQEELIRRLGSEKCFIVDFKEDKDANGVLVSKGKESLLNCLKEAKGVKVEGVFDLTDVESQMWDNFRNGHTRGSTTYIPEVDKVWTWREGEVNLWTGYQNEGKSLFLNQLCLLRSYWEDAKVAFFTPENMPMNEFYNDLLECFIGKSADPYYQNNLMSDDEFKQGLQFLKDRFFVIYPDKDFLLETIFTKARYLVRKKGIRTLVIDPYNTIDRGLKDKDREDLFISKFMGELKRFAIEEKISVHLVAHQLTARKNPNDGDRYYKPNLNSIKGGGTFSDKADNVLFVWRPNRAVDFTDTGVIFGSQKIKKQKLVGLPGDVIDIDYQFKSHRYLFNGVTPFTKVDNKRKGIEDVEEFFKEEPEVYNMTPEQAFEDDDIPF